MYRTKQEVPRSERGIENINNGTIGTYIVFVTILFVWYETIFAGKDICVFNSWVTYSNTVNFNSFIISLACSVQLKAWVNWQLNSASPVTKSARPHTAARGKWVLTITHFDNWKYARVPNTTVTESGRCVMSYCQWTQLESHGQFWRQMKHLYCSER